MNEPKTRNDFGSDIELSIDVLRSSLEAAVAAKPSDIAAQDAAQMASYMKDHFAFLGLKSPTLRLQAKPFIAARKEVSAETLISFVDRCWEQPEREFQYVGALVARRYAAKFGPQHLAVVERWITTKSWWDTVDVLAVWTVGPMVAASPQLSTTMDRWVGAEILDTNMWLARTAILHQLSYKDSIDADRLFSYASRRAADKEFFIRKAIGWSLRQHARQDPAAVRKYVLANEGALSGLTVREALKRIGRE